MSSPILHYRFNDSNIGADTSGNGTDLTVSGVSLITDPVVGPVASFVSGNVLTLPSASIPSSMTGTSSRTFVFLMRRDTTGGGTTPSLFDYGSSSTSLRKFDGQILSDKFVLDHTGGNLPGATTIDRDEWYHLAIAYGSGSYNQYLNGVLDQTRTRTLDTNPAQSFRIGVDFSGSMSNFRIYDVVLTPTEIVADFAGSFAFLNATPWSTLTEIDWSEASGATSYRVTHDTGSNEVVSINYTTSISEIVYNLEPETLYTLRVYYSTDDTSYSLHVETSITMLTDTSANANLAVFIQNGVYDLSSVNLSTRLILEEHIDNILVSGDKISFSDTVFVLVSRGGSSTIPESNPILFPFSQSEGSSQSATLELSDTTNVLVTYDDVNNGIVVGGVTYYPGDYFVLDGKKVTVYDVA